MIKHVSMLHVRNRICEILDDFGIRQSRRARHDAQFRLGIVIQEGKLLVAEQSLPVRHPAENSTHFLTIDSPTLEQGLQFLAQEYTSASLNVFTCLQGNTILEKSLMLPCGLTPRAIEAHLERYISACKRDMPVPLVHCFNTGIDSDFIPDEAAAEFDPFQGKESGILPATCKLVAPTPRPMFSCYLALSRQASCEACIVPFADMGFNLQAIETAHTALARLVTMLPDMSAILYRAANRYSLLVSSPIPVNSARGTRPRAFKFGPGKNTATRPLIISTLCTSGCGQTALNNMTSRDVERDVLGQLVRRAREHGISFASPFSLHLAGDPFELPIEQFPHELKIETSGFPHQFPGVNEKNQLSLNQEFLLPYALSLGGTGGFSAI